MIIREKKIINKLYDDCKVPKYMIKNVLDSYAQLIKDELENENQVQIRGFGTYKVIDLKPTLRSDPRTKKIIQIPTKKRAKFLFSQVFQKKINKKVK